MRPRCGFALLVPCCAVLCHMVWLVERLVLLLFMLVVAQLWSPHASAAQHFLGTTCCRRHVASKPALLRCRRPPKFDSSSSASQAADQLAALGLAESDGEGEGSSAAVEQPQSGRAAASAAAGAAGQAAGQEGGEAAEAADVSGGEEGGGYYSSEDDLPPIPKFNNRKVIEYEVSDSDSDDE